MKTNRKRATIAKIFLSLITVVAALAESVLADRKSLYMPNGDFLPHVRLAKDLVDKKRYDSRVRPVVNHSEPTKVSFSMSLYQILAINEKMQSVDLNVWVIQKWRDEFLGWNPRKYGMINNTILPYQSIWLPDTYLYNSIVMNREETERYINMVVSTDYWERQRGAQIKFMYPALYRYFPYDQQNCTMIISSWTSDKGSIDYTAEFDKVNLDNFIPNEEWVIVSFNIRRIEEKFVCCPDPWVLLEASLVVRRKPLYYIVNLVVPTSVITLVAVTGFFTPASTSNERREKLSLGIDSEAKFHSYMLQLWQPIYHQDLHAHMAYALYTPDYVPLFGLFYLSIIFIIFMGTLFTAFILNVHLQKTHNKPIPPLISFIFFHKVAPWLAVRPSTTLLELWLETGVRIRGLDGARHSTSMANAIRKRTTEQPSKKTVFTGIFNNQPNKNGKSKKSVNSNTKKDTWKHNKGAEEDKNGREEYQKQHLLTVDSSLSYNPRRNSSVYKHTKLLPLRPIGTTVGTAISSITTSRSQSPTSSLFNPQQLSNSYNTERSAKSIAARKNWKRIAQRASAKRREELSGESMCSLKSYLHDIPFADISPGRPPSTNEVIVDPISFASSPFSISGAAVAKPASAYPASQHQPSLLRQQRSGSIAMPALQLFNLSTAASAAAGLGGTSGVYNPLGNDAAMLDLKLRRRYAHEWEFLATVLDRVLLIIFCGLVALVTAAMVVVGEAIHFSYNLHEDYDQHQSNPFEQLDIDHAAPMATASPPIVHTDELFGGAPSGYYNHFTG